MAKIYNNTMKIEDINIDKFCSLATDASWQAWLYNCDIKLYQKFIDQLRNSKGCQQNKIIMQDLLSYILQSNNTSSLEKFLKSNHSEIFKTKVVPMTKDPIFGIYNSAIITYPRRAIFTGSDAEYKAKQIITNSIDHAILEHEGKIYLEYLLPKDKDIKDDIPPSKWKLKKND